jgi:phosphomevalonate kinase
MPESVYSLLERLAMEPGVVLCSVPGSGGYDAVYLILSSAANKSALATAYPEISIL